MKNRITDVEIKNTLSWFQKNKRDLPWRKSKDPYAIWVSEVMLQQTRIEAVKEKYKQFMLALASVKDLADCSEDKLLNLWQGLGYYSRAKNLQKTAKILMQNYDGKLPHTKKELIKLPGIGDYTASAISSIAYHEPSICIDGNILRIITRIYGLKDDVRLDQTKEKVKKILTPVFKKEIPYGTFNEALMELGETLCLPKGVPHCAKCPLSSCCKTSKTKNFEEIPYRSSLKERKIEDRTLFIIKKGNSFLLHKRAANQLLGNLYEFYGLERKLTKKEVEQEVRNLGYIPIHIQTLLKAKHIFTHREWHMSAYEIEVETLPKPKDKSYVVIKKEDFSSFAIPSAFQVYLNYYKIDY